MSNQPSPTRRHRAALGRMVGTAPPESDSQGVMPFWGAFGDALGALPKNIKLLLQIAGWVAVFTILGVFVAFAFTLVAYLTFPAKWDYPGVEATQRMLTAAPIFLTAVTTSALIVNAWMVGNFTRRRDRSSGA